MNRRQFLHHFGAHLAATSPDLDGLALNLSENPL